MFSENKRFSSFLVMDHNIHKFEGSYLLFYLFSKYLLSIDEMILSKRSAALQIILRNNNNKIQKIKTCLA